MGVGLCTSILRHHEEILKLNHGHRSIERSGEEEEGCIDRKSL